MNNKVDYNVLTLIDLLKRNIVQYPLKTAIIYRDQKYSYLNFFNAVAALSNYFISQGIAKGDRIALMMDKKTPDTIIAFLGIAACGGIVVPVDCNQPSEHIKKIFELVVPAAIIISDNVADLFELSKLELTGKKILICGDIKQNKKKLSTKYSIFSEIIKNNCKSLPDISINPHDNVYFNLTSGTTGFPKCAVTTHSNIYWNTRSAVEQLSLTHQDIHLCMFPTATHPHELFARSLLLGGTLVLTNKIAPKSLTKVIEDNGVTAMMAIAPFYGNLIQCHRKNNFHFTTLRIPESGGMHVDPITAELFKTKFGMPIVPVWGSTETSGIALAMPLNGKIKKGSCGMPCKYYEAKIVDQNGKELPPGEAGEMIVRGKGVCSYYYNNKEQTIKNFKNGWYWTNDIFKKDSNGYFYFLCRNNGMMKVAGMKVFPIEIEDVLFEYPLIKEAGVTKVNDRLHGELPKAVIVPEDGVTLTKKEIINYCKSRLAKYKIPRIIEFREFLPRNTTGKILADKL